MDKNLTKQDLKCCVREIIDEVFEENPKDFINMRGISRSNQQLKSTKNKILDAIGLRHIESFLNDSFILISRYLNRVTTTDEHKQTFEEFHATRKSVNRYYKNILDSTELPSHPTLQAILGYSDETLRHCYHLGLYFFHEGNIVDANKIFSLLYLLSPQIPSFWCAAAVCCKDLNQYHSALGILSRAKKLHPENPAICIHRADCYLNTGEYENAIFEINHAEILIAENMESSAWEQAISSLKKQINDEEQHGQSRAI